jgi:hypothetical protein
LFQQYVYGVWSGIPHFDRYLSPSKFYPIFFLKEINGFRSHWFWKTKPSKISAFSHSNFDKTLLVQRCMFEQQPNSLDFLFWREKKRKKKKTSSSSHALQSGWSKLRKRKKYLLYVNLVMYLLRLIGRNSWPFLSWRNNNSYCCYEVRNIDTSVQQ